MPEDFRETLIELGDAVIARKPHVQPIDVLRMALEAEQHELAPTLPGHVLLDLDMGEPIRVLESTWVSHEGASFYAVWGLAILEGQGEPTPIKWHGLVETFDAAAFEIDTVCQTSTVDLSGLVAAFEQVVFDDLLA